MLESSWYFRCRIKSCWPNINRTGRGPYPFNLFIHPPISAFQIYGELLFSHSSYVQYTRTGGSKKTESIWYLPAPRTEWINLPTNLFVFVEDAKNVCRTHICSFFYLGYFFTSDCLDRQVDHRIYRWYIVCVCVPHTCRSLHAKYIYHIL